RHDQLLLTWVPWLDFAPEPVGWPGPCGVLRRGAGRLCDRTMVPRHEPGTRGGPLAPARLPLLSRTGPCSGSRREGESQSERPGDRLLAGVPLGGGSCHRPTIATHRRACGGGRAWGCPIDRKGMTGIAAVRPVAGAGDRGRHGIGE